MWKSLWSSCQEEGGGSSWIPVSLWGLTVLIQEYSKRWLISSQDLSQWFFNDLGNLGRSQSTGHWLMLAQYSRRVGRMTLKTTGLSVSYQCVVKLWTRLFWSYWKTLKGHHSHLLQPAWVHVKPSFFLWQGSLSSWSREARWCHLFGFP